MKKDRGRTRIAKTRIDKIIGANIQNERILRSMSRDELADIIDLNVSHLGLIERGGRGATPVTLEKVVRTFGISIDSLFKDSGCSKKSAINQREDASDTYYKKVSALITNLAEPELEFLTYIIEGLGKTRKNDEII